MDPNPASFPILSYVMARIPSLGPKPAPPSFDIEQPDPARTLTGPPPELPRLSDPNLVAAMTKAVADVAQTRSVLHTLGPRPDHETLDAARNRLAEIESGLAKQLEGVVLSQRPPEIDSLEWRAHLADKEQELRREADRERTIYQTVIQLEDMHSQYDKLLKDAEARLVALYEKGGSGGDEIEDEEVVDEADEEVVGILSAASGGLDMVDLSDRKIRFLPEAFGRIPGLRILNVSSNQLEVIPDSISALEMLEELNLSSNLLESLPDSIGLLHNLRILNVSSNKLELLPDSICNCRLLVELDVSFNRLTYLPTNIGNELVNLKQFSIQLNKIRTLPSSIGNMKSLELLDAHFNELNGLPLSFRRLTNLEILNLSSNFSDLTELPETFGELTNLRELDLSNNQIHALPDTFGRLDNLTKLNLDQNPIVTPPTEVVKDGAEAVKMFMSKRWLDILEEEERRSIQEAQEQAQTGWLTRSTSLLKSYASSVSESVSGYLSPRTPRDPYLDQQL